MNINQYRCDGKMLYLLNTLNHSLNVQNPYEPEVKWFYFSIIADNRWYYSINFYQKSILNRPVFMIAALPSLEELGFRPPFWDRNVSMEVLL